MSKWSNCKRCICSNCGSNITVRRGTKIHECMYCHDKWIKKCDKLWV